VIERQTELKRRHHRKLKMRKLKAKLALISGEARTALLLKIRKLSPTWTEASLKPVVKSDVPKADKPEKEVRRKAPAKRPEKN